VPHDVEVQVGPVEAAGDDQRLTQPEPLDDVVPHGRRRRRGEGEDGRVAETVDGVPEAQVVGAEVMSPGRDAVGLVHDHERRRGLGQPLDDVLLGELLR